MDQNGEASMDIHKNKTITGNLFGLKMTSFVPYLVKGMQEQQVEINDLKSQVSSLQAQVNALVAATKHLHFFIF